MGIAFAFIALICWGLGDFLIQRSARKFGDWVALFYITAFAAVILFPFIWHDIPELLSRETLPLVLWVASLVILLAALLDFEALRVGKISVVEPIYALEVPLTVILGTFVLQEFLSPIQSVFIITLIIGIILVATKSFHHLKGIHTERGVWYALFATIGMGATNFLFGIGARETSPLIINWFTSTFLACFTFGYLLVHGRLREIVTGWRSHRKLITGVSIIDNCAWVAFAYSTLTIPVSIATGISESYIGLAAILGLIINKEKLRKHQWAGIALTVASAVALAFIIERA